MYKVVAPAVKFEGRIGRAFLEMEKAVVDRVVIGDLFQRAGAEDGGHLILERSREEPVDIVIAVVGENETAVLDVTTEIISLLWIELDEFVAADIGKGIVKDLGAIEVEDFFLQVYGDGGVLDQ